MTDPQLLDFRTFHFLTVVHREGSFSRAAETLGVSQSMVSYGIEKLRQVFDDPLFVREAGRTVPTARCDELAAYALELLSQFEAIQAKPEFDPAASTETLTIACNYYERTFLIPAIVGALRSKAPRLKVEVVDAPGGGHVRLLNGEADLLIGPYRRTDASFYEKALFSDRYVCLLDPGHPAAGADPTLEEYLAFEHIIITYGGRWVSPYIRVIETMGRRLNAPLRAPSPAGIDRFVSGSTLVATIPRRLAMVQDPSLAIVECPVDATVDVKMVWSVRNHHSVFLKWVRDLVSRTVSGLS